MSSMEKVSKWAYYTSIGYDKKEAIVDSFKNTEPNWWTVEHNATAYNDYWNA